MHICICINTTSHIKFHFAWTHIHMLITQYQCTCISRSTHIYNFITNDEIMNTKTRFWDQLSAPDPPKWATRAQEAPQRASMHFWKIYEKKWVKTYVFFQQKWVAMDWDSRRSAATRTMAAKNWYISRAQNEKQEKKGVMIDVKITKHQYLHAIESDRGP